MKKKFILRDIYAFKDLPDAIYKTGYDWTLIKGFKLEKIDDEASLLTLDITVGQSQVGDQTNKVSK